MCPASDPADNRAPALHLHRPARLQDASELRYALTGWARTRDLPEALIADLELAAYEALVNSAEHAYPDGTTGTLDLHAHHDDHTVRVTVTDHGQWRPQPAPDPLRGRGLPLIHLLADHADIAPTDQGTVITMAWQLTRDR
ncbi:ATP-binding protein [Amycolatopsis sp. FDAARGOS 1241]|uniref:ATP-binding protein n=1 Tax=Amycolatopsis sp. FDAARGOS 1241 TaxID=2778070 RepID=UPI00194F8028|nr:ATP-binding protein [Amycolatopsis sp. FDAARGOS 1241]QRP43023.1 ATP-binding protein [Amycolatopsis sp. FDAARGOS 1241]